MNSFYTKLFGLSLIATLAIIPVGASAASASGSFDEEAFASVSTKPSLTGEADDTRYVRVVVRTEAGKSVFKKDVRVKADGEWKTKVTKRLKKGDYEVFLYAGKTSKRSALLDEATLTVGDTSGSSAGVGKGTTLSASMLPLLFGGTTRAGASVPVAYVKIVNTSSKESAIEGITLVQNGSAPVSVVTSFSTNDDKGGSRSTVNASWKGNTTFVPLSATFAPGQMRIFTVKATMGTDAMLNIGKQLALNVSGIGTGAELPKVFPIRGTTWTLGY